MDRPQSKFAHWCQATFGKTPDDVQNIDGVVRVAGPGLRADEINTHAEAVATADGVMFRLDSWAFRPAWPDLAGAAAVAIAALCILVWGVQEPAAMAAAALLAWLPFSLRKMHLRLSAAILRVQRSVRATRTAPTRRKKPE